MRINSLRVRAKSVSTHKWLYTAILLTCFMLITGITWATVPINRTASDILDHAVNLSGVPQSNGYESQNNGLTFSPIDKPAAKQPNEVAKTKKSDSSNDRGVVASLD